MRRLLIAATVATLSALTSQSVAAQSVEERLDRLEQHQRRMEDELRQKDERIRELEAQLAGKEGPPSAVAEAAPAEVAPSTASPGAPAAVVAAQEPGSPAKWGAFEPGKGFVVARTDLAELDFSIFTYVRYLNQKGLDETYTDSFGRTRQIDRRSDMQLQKVNLTFKGWLLDPDFRYQVYAWTSNTSQGQSAQVVLAGYLGYRFNDYFRLLGGIGALPSTRTTNGTFPNWLKVDHRTIADEYFRGSYTSGVWAEGQVSERSRYRVMVGNNLSQLGVDGQQLDNHFNTVSSAVWWMPTTGEFGPAEGFGDFEFHEEVATLFGVHYTNSREDAQSQPGTEDPENSQIRISDGTSIFDVGAFGAGTRIQKATYQMWDVNAGVKYRGFSLDAEYYWRLVDDLSVTGAIPEDNFRDHGFQLQASAMLVPQSLQAYLAGSKIYGQYGDPSDISFGLNWFPFKSRALRVNGQLLYLDDSPTGNSAVPFALGGNGLVWSTDIMMAF
jgi:hypothetical protein